MQHQAEGRFIENKLVTWLIDQLPGGQNSISIESQSGKYDEADYDQILQLIGYSTSGIPYRNRDLFAITDGQKKPEEVYEEAYKKLKKALAPIMEEVYDTNLESN
jgi:hypothetical protein